MHLFRHRRTSSGILALFFGLFILTACDKGTEKEPEVSVPANQGTYAPAPFPPSSVTGIDMPTSRATLDSLIDVQDSSALMDHAWGIWVGLTTPTDIVVNNRNLLVYESWLDVQQLDFAAKNGISYDSLIKTPRPTNHLTHLRQLTHTLTRKADLMQAQAVLEKFNTNESVKYNGPAGKFVLDNNYLLASTLNGLVKKGDTASISDFPADAITLKPTYFVLDADSAQDGRYYQIPAWPGPPGSYSADTAGFGPEKWGYAVWIDTQNQAHGDGSFIPTDAPRSDLATYNLSDFIYFKLTAEDAKDMNINNGTKSNEAGDIAVLLAMHVTSKETKRWTWQTFWWSSDPYAVIAPTSETMIQARPDDKLQGAAAHYSGHIAYSMIWPGQPETGGNNEGTPIFTFNPYLEAGFNSNVFTPRENNQVINNGTTIWTDAGVRTNCMSCHALASYSNLGKSTPYVGDTYIDLADTTFFNSVVKVDFLWSIQANVQE